MNREDLLLTDEELEVIAEQVKTGSFIDYKGMTCPDFGIAICQAQLNKALPLVFREIEVNISRDYPSLVHAWTLLKEKWLGGEDNVKLSS